MKIDKSRPSHWYALLMLGIYALVAYILRPIVSKINTEQKKPLVILYGHKLSGNLLAIYQYWQKHADTEFDFVFLTMDKTYFQELEKKGFKTALATRFYTIGLLSKAKALISDHGLHSMSFMAGHSSLKCFDVWHGIMFKGFAPEDFRTQHRYTETWVTSNLLKRFYTAQFGFKEQRVHITGYARTDCLMDGSMTKEQARQAFNLPLEGKLILFAPTWQRDTQNGSIYPFAVPEQDFLQALSNLAQECHATVIMRTHMNTSSATAPALPHIIYRPSAVWPEAERLLLACDVLVCDWSSIAFDWLLLKRPTVFLEVPMPTPRGFTLGPEYRFGDVVTSAASMLASIIHAVITPEEHLARFSEQRNKILSDVYDHYADGYASGRCIDRLRLHICQ